MKVFFYDKGIRIDTEHCVGSVANMELTTVVLPNMSQFEITTDFREATVFFLHIFEEDIDEIIQGALYPSNVDSDRIFFFLTRNDHGFAEGPFPNVYHNEGPGNTRKRYLLFQRDSSKLVTPGEFAELLTCTAEQAVALINRVTDSINNVTLLETFDRLVMKLSQRMALLCQIFLIELWAGWPDYQYTIDQELKMEVQETFDASKISELGLTAHGAKKSEIMRANLEMYKSSEWWQHGFTGIVKHGLAPYTLYEEADWEWKSLSARRKFDNKQIEEHHSNYEKLLQKAFKDSEVAIVDVVRGFKALHFLFKDDK